MCCSDPLSSPPFLGKFNVLGAARGRIRDLAAIAREAAELAECVARWQQLALACAVRADQIIALALVAADVRTVDDPIAARRPVVERDAFDDRELARPAAATADRPDLRRGGDRADRELHAVAAPERSPCERSRSGRYLAARHRRATTRSAAP